MTKRNNNRKQKKSTKKKTAKKINNTPTMRNTNITQLARAVCSVTDPFCPAAKGTKQSTFSTTPSLAFQHKYLAGLVADANGRGCLLVVPGYTYSFASASAQTGAVATFTSFNTANSPALGATRYRVVSMGITLASILNSMVDSGLVQIRVYNFGNAGQFGTVDVSTYNNLEQYNIPFSKLTGTTLIFKPTDPSFAQYRTVSQVQPTAAVADMGALPWTAIVIGFVTSNVVSQQVGTMEVRINYEITFDDDNANAMLLTGPPKTNPLVDRVQQTIYSTSSSLFKSGAQAVESYITSKAKAALLALLPPQIKGPAMLANAAYTAMEVD